MVEPGSRPDLPGQRDLADEGRSVGRCHIACGGHERRRDGQVGSRVVHPNAARDGAEELRSAERETRASLEHRGDLLEPAELEPRYLAPSRPVARAHERLNLDRKRPATGQRKRERGAGMGLAGTQQLRRVDRREPGRAHLEPGGLAFGAEPILPAGDHPEPRPGIALERQDDIDRVLERPRAGQIAVLRHVARENDRDPLLLRHLHEGIGAAAHLGDPPGLRAGAGVAERLDRVDGEDGGTA